MKTRLRLLALLVTPILILGCYRSSNSSGGYPDKGQSGTEKVTRARELPLAPAPRPKKSATELLVGTWKQIEWNGKEIPKKWQYYREFTAGGTFRFSDDDRKHPPDIISGTYRLINDQIFFRTPSASDGKEREWTVFISLISDTHLEIQFDDGKEISVKKFHRQDLK